MRKWPNNKIYHKANENCDVLAEAALGRPELSGLHSEFESTSASCSASSDARFSRPKSSSNALPVNDKHMEISYDANHKLLYQLYHNYYNRFTALWILSGTTWVSRYQKSKTKLDLLQQEIVSGSSISWAICKSAP